MVEVAVNSHAEDLAKLPGYADASVTTVWLVDVPGRTVRVFTDPRGREYASERVLSAGDTLVAPAAGVPPLAVSDLFAVLDR